MKYRGYFFAFLSATLYGSIGILVKNGISENFSPIDLLMLQLVVSIMILLVICGAKYRKDIKLSRVQFRQLLILGGISNTAIMVCNYQSYKYLSVAVATVILYTYPALVAIASAVIFKERVSKNKIVAIVGTFLGCLLIINIFSPKVFSTISLPGMIYAFVAACFFTFFNLYAVRILVDIKPIILTFYNCVFTLLVLLIFNFDFVGKLGYLNIDMVEHATMLAILCGILPSVLYYIALKNIGSIPVSIIGSLEIPIAAVLSWMLLGDSLSLIQIVGVVLSVASVILLKFEPNQSAE